MRYAAYDQNVVIDLEFTNIPKALRPDKLRFEVIEIGAVRVSSDGRILDSFHSMVCPQIAPGVSDVVRNLTGIIDADICDADTFEAALAHLSDWIGQGRTRLVAWSENDYGQIMLECAAKDIEIPNNMRRWLDLQRIVPRLLQVGPTDQCMSLRDAAGWAGLDLGLEVEHRALDDAMHTAKLLRMVLTGGHLVQRAALSQVMPTRSGNMQKASVGAGLMASALAGLYSQMTASGVIAA